MIKLNENDLSNIKGGMTVTGGIGIGIVVTAVITFLSGIIRGYTNPEVCNVKGN
ncbi:MAG: bacteriocin [Bacilli bacterium]|nr:bacteriocin [Bacilli bacterium]